MAPADWHSSRPVKPPAEFDELLQDPSRMDFFAALRWLQARLEMPSIGTALSPLDERLRFAQDPSLGFAPAAISKAVWDEDKERIELKLCFTGLLGPNGPMPVHLTEYVLDRRNHSHDQTLEAFLNLFHHRIYSLMFRAWSLNQPTVDFEEKNGRRFGEYFRCLVGMGTDGADQQESVPAAANLFYSGWLGALNRSPEGLGAILSDFLGVAVVVHPFQEMWLDLPNDSQCRLGRSRLTGIIGKTCIAGERIAVSNLKFRLRIGPLHWTEYENLFPKGNAFRQVSEWVRTYIGDEFFWEVQLVLRRNELPDCRLGGGVRLGWSTWLGEPAATSEVDDLIVQSA